MRVYSVLPHVDFPNACPVDDDDWELYFRLSGKQGFQGASKLQGWQPLNLGVSEPTLRRGDFFSFVDYTFVCSEKASVELSDIFTGTSELLPVKVEGRPCFVVNVIKVIDALDYEKSVPRILNDSVVQGIDHFAFNPALELPALFRVPQSSMILTPSGPPYAAFDFKQRCEQAGFEGLEFR